MELVKEYVNQWEERQPKTIKVMGMGMTSNRRVYDEGALQRAFGMQDDVRVFFGDQEIGTMQSITMERHEEPREMGSIMQREATFVMQNAHVDTSMLRELHRLIEADQPSTFEIVRAQEPNREERRMKPSRKKGEDYKDDYRKGLHNMLGGKKRWN
jgi:hypothetical protein